MSVLDWLLSPSNASEPTTEELVDYLSRRKHTIATLLAERLQDATTRLELAQKNALAASLERDEAIRVLNRTTNCLWAPTIEARRLQGLKSQRCPDCNRGEVEVFDKWSMESAGYTCPSCKGSGEKLVSLHGES